MSMQGIGPSGLPNWLQGPAQTPAERPTRAPAQPGTTHRPEATTTPSAQRAAPAAAREADLAAGAAPEGVDAELWSLLTTEERAHFARFAAMGGVTYGPGANRASRPPVQGGRLDLKI